MFTQTSLAALFCSKHAGGFVLSTFCPCRKVGLITAVDEDGVEECGVIIFVAGEADGPATEEPLLSSP